MFSLPSIEELNREYKPSLELDKRINSIISKDYRRSKVNWFSKKLGKVAAFICILFTMSSVVSLSVSATRNVIFNAVIQLQEKYTEVKFGESTTYTDIYQPTYLPKGGTDAVVNFDLTQQSRLPNDAVVYSMSMSSVGSTAVKGISIKNIVKGSTVDLSTYTWSKDGLVSLNLKEELS